MQNHNILRIQYVLYLCMLLNSLLWSSPLTLRENRTHQVLCCVWHVCACICKIAASAWKEWKTRPTSSSISSSCFNREFQTCSTCVKRVSRNSFRLLYLQNHLFCSVHLFACVSACKYVCVRERERAWVHCCFCFLHVNPFLRCLMDNRCGKHANSTFPWTCKCTIALWWGDYICHRMEASA